MAAAAREYELVLMLDPGGDEVARDALAQEAKARIEASGTLKHENKWGLRKMAYEIGQHNEADYRWFRFEAPTELLDGLNHSLRIADGVMRFRIFKVDADTPVLVPPATGSAGPAASRERPTSGAPRDEAEPAAAPAEAEPVATEPEPAAAEPPAETEPAAAEPPAEAAAEPAEPASEPAPVAAEEPSSEAADSGDE